MPYLPVNRTPPMAVPIKEPTKIDGSTNSLWDGILPSNTSASSVRLTGTSKVQKKIGILGLGSIGSRHFQNFKDLGCEVLGYDPFITPLAQDREYVLDWADSIVIATPTARHHLDFFDCYT